MKTALVFLTIEEKFGRYVDLKKVQILPDSLRAIYQNNLFVRSFVVHETADAEKICRFLAGVMNSAESVILFIDSDLSQIREKFAKGFFTQIFTSSAEGKSFHNYLGMIIPPVLRSFKAYSERFSQKKFQDILLLPLDNFDAEEMRSIRALFFENPIKIDTFSNKLDKLLSEMRSRRSPKTYENGRKMFIVDNKKRYFEYGAEKHARFDSKSPPHNFYCGLNGSFRYGIKFDKDKHFNVSESGKISGLFINCHGDEIDVQPCSHLNMFANGFW